MNPSGGGILYRQCRAAAVRISVEREAKQSRRSKFVVSGAAGNVSSQALLGHD